MTRKTRQGLPIVDRIRFLSYSKCVVGWCSKEDAINLTAASLSLLLFSCARSYGDLESKGAKIVWGDFSEGVGNLIPEGESFDYVFDNYAKDVGTCEDLTSCAKTWYVP